LALRYVRWVPRAKVGGGPIQRDRYWYSLCAVGTYSDCWAKVGPIEGWYSIERWRDSKGLASPTCGGAVCVRLSDKGWGYSGWVGIRYGRCGEGGIQTGLVFGLIGIGVCYPRWA